MHKLLEKLSLSFLLLCLAAPVLHGLENEDEQLDNLIAQAIQGDENSIATIRDNISNQELAPEVRSEYIEALVLVAQAGIPSAQEIFYQIVSDYIREIPVHGATQAFMKLLPVFENIIRNEMSSDLIVISAIKATIGVFAMTDRNEAPLNMLHKNLGRLKDLLKNTNPDEKHSDELKMEVAYALAVLLMCTEPANFDDISKAPKEVISDPQVFHLSRARLIAYLVLVATYESSYGTQLSQMAFSVIQELIPTIEEILSDKTNWSLDDLMTRALKALKLFARRKNEQAIGLIERQIPQFKALSMEEGAELHAENIVSILITACVNGSQPAAECLISFITAEAYIDKVKEVSIGKLAEKARDGNSYAASTLRKAYARMAGVNDGRHIPFSEFLWPDKRFPYWALKELLINRVVNSLNPESLLDDIRPLALMIFAEEGEPVISVSKKLLLPIFIQAGYRVLLYEASTDVELCEVAEEATPLDIKADIALIMGHGSSEGGVQLGLPSSGSNELYRLDSSDMEEMRSFGSRLADEAAVVFFSCLLGQGREDNKDSVPNRFAEAVPHIRMIFSADGTIRTNYTHTKFEFDSEGKLTNAEFFFSNPDDDMYIINLDNMHTRSIESAVEEKARMKLTTTGRIKSQDSSLRIETSLGQNYPNPFNPETWIPYQLAEPAKVTIRIYDQNGRLLRTLDLGDKQAGIYNIKATAAHWDGKNESGEEVASGIYYYTIDAGDFFATRKMIVRK